MKADVYPEEQLLMLSGIQHYAFCKRQWSLIHVEQQWSENVLTYEGRQLHRRADDPYFSEKRGDVLVTRAMPLVCYQYGYYGVADVVEFHAVFDPEDLNKIRLPGREGEWRPFPVEYKRGRPKSGDWDEVQLCAQAIALEEMLGIRLHEGALFYGERERRMRVVFETALRERVVVLFAEMHQLLSEGRTFSARYSSKCKSCSLLDQCEPKASSKQTRNYLQNYLKQSTSEND